MIQVDQKLQDYKLSKKMLKAFYGISYPTLRKRLRTAGLQHFIGRRKFLFAEFLLIFKALGQPQEIEKEIEELAFIYEQLLNLGLIKGQSQKALPQKKKKKQSQNKNRPALRPISTPLDLWQNFLQQYYQVLLLGLELLYGEKKEKWLAEVA